MARALAPLSRPMEKCIEGIRGRRCHAVHVDGHDAVTADVAMLVIDATSLRRVRGASEETGGEETAVLCRARIVGTHRLENVEELLTCVVV